MGEDAENAGSARLSAERLSADQLDALRPYVVALQGGKFATTAELNTTAADVGAIVSHHLPAFARSRGPGPVPVVFWAHGGLVEEQSALTDAQRNIPWWLANGIYPIHFVWHSGLWDTLGDLLASHLGELAPATFAATRPSNGAAITADVTDFTDFTDGIIENLLRKVGGPAVWEAMKDNARRASEPGGGAIYVAEALRTFLMNHHATVHAAGFSAGSYFHRYFVPTVVQNSKATFSTCSLLVPSLRTESFKAGLAPLLGAGIESLSVFGMREELALADNTFGRYRKSLLYLIQGAFDATPGTPLLGLERSVLDDPVLSALFRTSPALGSPQPTRRAEAVWSVATTGPLNARSTATTHITFDDDVPTMDSVARRIGARDDIISYGTTRHPGILAAMTNTARTHLG